MFEILNPIVHNPIRLAILNLLIQSGEMEFTNLKKITNSSAGNLSIQINKLKDSGYVEVTKQFKNNYPQTICKITEKGTIEFNNYVKVMHAYLNPVEKFN